MPSGESVIQEASEFLMPLGCKKRWRAREREECYCLALTLGHKEEDG